MKLRLNLATNPAENNRPFLLGMTATGLVALIALVFLSHSAFHSYRANRDLRRDIARLDSQMRASERQQRELAAYFETPAAKQVLNRAAFLNSMIEQRSFPWTKLFTDLEQTMPAGVHVVDIVPDLKGGRVSVKITVGALSDDSKVKFLEALEASKEFSDVEVTQEKHVEMTGSPDRIMLELQAWYETT